MANRAAINGGGCGAGVIGSEWPSEHPPPCRTPQKTQFTRSGRINSTIDTHHPVCAVSAQFMVCCLRHIPVYDEAHHCCGDYVVRW
jgi:hypothetical protein